MSETQFLAFDSEGDSVHEHIYKCLDAAHLAISEYYNGDRAWAERWLILAYEANQSQKETK